MTLKEVPKDKDTVVWSKTVKRKESQCVNPDRLWPTLLGESRPGQERLRQTVQASLVRELRPVLQNVKKVERNIINCII